MTCGQLSQQTAVIFNLSMMELTVWVLIFRWRLGCLEHVSPPFLNY